MKLIDGVAVKKLKVVSDERGWLTEILRNDDPAFRKFGQVYATTAYPGVVKAWHCHKKQWDNFACVNGMMKVALWDSRPESPTYRVINEFFVGIHNPCLITVPPLVYHGFKCIGKDIAFFVNVPSETYNYKKPDDIRLAPNSKKIDYDWILNPCKANG